MENLAVSLRFIKKLLKFFLLKAIKTCSQFNINVSILSIKERIWLQEIWQDLERPLLLDFQWLSTSEDIDILAAEEFKPFVLLQLESLLSKSQMKLPSWSIMKMSSELLQCMEVSTLRNKPDNWKMELISSLEQLEESWITWKEETSISQI